MMKSCKFRGYTLIELMVGISVVVLITMTSLPDFVRATDRAKEEATKSNLHTIQLALERYATDNGGEYPYYILGGDQQGWDVRTGCRAITMPSYESVRPPRDPLIEGGYMNSYPSNPFIQPSDGVNTIIMATGASGDPGDGDVRFGFYGETMGNCLDDPRYLFGDSYFPGNLNWTMYPIPGAYLGVTNHNSPNSFYCMGGIPEWSREQMGSSDVNKPTFRNWWPGEFFYRSGGVFNEPVGIGRGGHSESRIWDWRYIAITRYMLGAYGSVRTDGMDVIRLTIKAGNAACTADGAINGVITGEYYQDNMRPDRYIESENPEFIPTACHPDYSVAVGYSNPEVFGGGGPGLMPQFPYYTSGLRDWMYGAPDGRFDGIILVLTSADNEWESQEEFYLERAVEMERSGVSDFM